MLEKEIEKKLVDRIKAIGGKAYKFISPGHIGVPDRIVILPGNNIRICRNKSTRTSTTSITASKV